MALGKSYQYFDLSKPILPYISYTSPVNESPHFVQGSQNIMASQIGYLEKRPGFNTTLEGTGTELAGVVKRIFTWRRWNGDFYGMACSVNGSTSVVYGINLTSGVSFVPIWTSTSNVPFDFIVSNNFVYFGNGTDMKKWDGTTVSKWGCDAPPAAPLISLQTGVLPPGMTISGDTISGTPTTLGTSQITWTVTDAAAGTASKTFNFNVIPAVLTITSGSYLPVAIDGSLYSTSLLADFGFPAYTWTLFSGTLPPGLTLSGAVISGTPTTPGLYPFAIKVTDSHSATAVKSFYLAVNSSTPLALTPTSLPDGQVGTAYTPTALTASGGTGPYTFSILPDFGPHVDPITGLIPQGLAFTQATPDITFSGTPTIPNAYQFTVQINDSVGNVTYFPMPITIQPTALTIVTSALPDATQGHPYSFTIGTMGGTTPYAYTYTAGSLDAQTGYIYGYTYTTVYGHESNMSDLSVTTGIFTGEDPTVAVIASADPQVNHINIYRTTDGGEANPAVMRLVVTLSNTTQNYADSTLDINLGTQTGPGFLINTPPTPSRGFVWSNGRIYGFNNASTYYSGLEEVSNGVPEEAWPSGLDGNYYNWPSQVGGMAVTENGVDVGLSEQFWQISGDSLDTFRKSLLLDKAGVGSPTCINSVGNSVQWFDSAKQVWSSSLGEYGEPIRTDVATGNPQNIYIGYHKSGNYNWMYLLDSDARKLYIYDLDTDQWYPPWTISATAIWSGEIAVGKIALLVAIAGTVYVLSSNPVQYLDAGKTYEDDIKTNLIPISPGRMTSARSKIEPTQVEEILFEMGADNFEGTYPAFVGQLCDDDPVRAPILQWFNLTANNVTPQFIPRRQFLCQYRFIADSVTDPAIRAAFWIQFAPVNGPWKIFSLTISWIRA